jgi:hypothetical protein
VAERTDMKVAMRLDQTPWAFDLKSVKVERR